MPHVVCQEKEHTTPLLEMMGTGCFGWMQEFPGALRSGRGGGVKCGHSHSCYICRRPSVSEVGQEKLPMNCEQPHSCWLPLTGVQKRLKHHTHTHPFVLQGAGEDFANWEHRFSFCFALTSSKLLFQECSSNDLISVSALYCPHVLRKLLNVSLCTLFCSCVK